LLKTIPRKFRCWRIGDSTQLLDQVSEQSCQRPSHHDRVRLVSLPDGPFCHKLTQQKIMEDLPNGCCAVGSGFAAELRAVTLADVASDDAAYAAARAAFEEHSVLVFRGQEVTDEIQLAFSRRFGPPEVTKVGSQGTGTHFVILSTIGPDGKVVPPDHRVALRNKANQLWHTDSSFKRVPALTSILSARIIPARGGETEFVSTRLAFRAARSGVAREAREFLCLARLRAFAQPDHGGSREPGGARGAAAAMLAHGVEESRQRPWRDLSRPRTPTPSRAWSRQRARN
jgi:hypothetical protein